MKNLKLSLVVLLSTATAIHAQTCDQLVATGRVHLANGVYPLAQANFESALSMCPHHQEAHALLAGTRLLAWQETPAGSNLLTRLGVPAEGRFLRDWTATAQRDIEGLPLAPAGVQAREISHVLRTNLLGAVVASLANLSSITNTGFLLNLSSNETGSAEVTLDHGDIQMLRAMLHAGEYYIYTCYSWNLDAQLSVLREVIADGPNTLETLFRNHPALLSYATTNDLALARASFVNACNRYQAASALIRARDPLLVRLFNVDDVQVESEADFRRTLDDLKVALTNAVVLWDNTNYTLNLQPHFAGQTPPRAFLPQFRANRFGLGTLPDTTFGGSVTGLTEGDSEELLSGLLDFVPAMVGGVMSNGTFVALARGEPYWTYQLQASTDYVKWKTVDESDPVTEMFALQDPDAGQYPGRAYRVFNLWDSLISYPDNDWFFDSAWMPDRTNYASANTTAASKETWNNEPDHDGNPGGKSVWWTWMAPANGVVTVSTQGSTFDTVMAVYLQPALPWDLSTLPYVASDDDSGGNYTSWLQFDAVAGTLYYVAVDGYNGAAGTVNIKLTMP